MEPAGDQLLDITEETKNKLAPISDEKEEEEDPNSTSMVSEPHDAIHALLNRHRDRKSHSSSSNSRDVYRPVSLPPSTQKTSVSVEQLGRAHKKLEYNPHSFLELEETGPKTKKLELSSVLLSKTDYLFLGIGAALAIGAIYGGSRLGVDLYHLITGAFSKHSSVTPSL